MFLYKYIHRPSVEAKVPTRASDAEACPSWRQSDLCHSPLGLPGHRLELGNHTVSRGSNFHAQQEP